MSLTPAPFRMPPEWAPHERTWMAWPGPNPTFASDAELDEARRAWAAVARAVRRFEPVTMVVGPGQEEGAAALLGPDVELVVRPSTTRGCGTSAPPSSPTAAPSPRSTGRSTAGARRAGPGGRATSTSRGPSPR
ncbi:Agmatine deiminase [Streptomyces californicus]